MAAARWPASRIRVECSLAIGRIRIAQAELGVVDHRRQRVVELVEHTAGKDPQTADPLKRDDLPAQRLHLLAIARGFGLCGRREDPGGSVRSCGRRGGLRCRGNEMDSAG